VNPTYIRVTTLSTNLSKYLPKSDINIDERQPHRKRKTPPNLSKNYSDFGADSSRPKVKRRSKQTHTGKKSEKK
jgi:hypothetical protein